MDVNDTLSSNLRNIIERILGNARECKHTANNVHVHRQLIGELRAALASKERNPLAVNLEILGSLVRFAYQNGYHELGYDVLAEAVAQLRGVHETRAQPGVLEVGLAVDETMVILNHPQIDQDERGGYIMFSPSDARHLGELLLKKAGECRAVTTADD